MIRYADPITAVRTDPAAPRWGQTVTGYGARIPTRYAVKCASTAQPNRWRRVYAACYGNAATLFITVEGTDLVIPDTVLDILIAAAREA